MLIYSMGVSVDGYIADREGAFDWTAPSEELFRFHLALVSELGGYLCGGRLYETMLVWETDPSMRETEDGDAFAAVPAAGHRRRPAGLIETRTFGSRVIYERYVSGLVERRL